MNTREMDMTEGSLWKKIILFSLPLMLSNLLQVLFNLADVAVVGQFVGSIALGSVGSTSMLLSLTIGIMMGLGGGVNAVTARAVGAKDKEEVSRSVHSGLLLCLITGVLLLLAGLFLSRRILLLMGTKEELIDGAKTYMTIYLLGSPAVAIYNYGNGVLGAIGDTKRPLLYMTVAGVLNVGMNLFFVLVFDMGVAGVALASVISQYISAFLILRYLFVSGREGKEYGLVLSKIRLYKYATGRILAIGVPSAVQYSLFAIANLFIQSAVNSFDHVIVEGNSAAANADNLVYDMMAAFYVAAQSFIAQNLGAGKKARIAKAYGISLLYSAAVGFVMGGLLVIFREPFLHIFTKDADVIAYGRIRLFIMGLSYGVSAFMDDATAAARGLGKSVFPTIIVIMGTVVYRIIWVNTVFAHFHTLPSLYLVFVTAWVFTAIAGNIYFFAQYRKIGKNC